MTRPIAWTVTVLIGVAVVTVAGYLAYHWWGAKHALERTMAALTSNQAVPADVRLDTRGLSVWMAEPGRFAAALRQRPGIADSMAIWEKRYPFIWTAHQLAAGPDLDLVCEVIRRDTWNIHCGQIRCAPEDPCVFRTAEGMEFTVVTEPSAK